ncbi:MAG: hypothetical protein AAF430_21365 [Myxococcota bacterium]
MRFLVRRSSVRVAALLLAGALLGASGCSTRPIRPEMAPYMLRVAANGAAHPVDTQRLPAATGRCTGIRAQVDRVMQGFEAYYAREEKPHVGLFLHGGLVSLDASAAASRDSLNALLDEKLGNQNDRRSEPRDWLSELKPEEVHRALDFYPIFVGSSTEFWSSYSDYAFSIRNGEENRAYALLTFPFLLLADTGRAIARTPQLVERQMGAALRASRFGEIEESPDGWEHIEDVELPSADLTANLNLSNGVRVLTFPFLLVSTPLLDLLGQGAYQNMLRRTHLLIQLDSDTEGTTFGECGVLNQLMARLRRFEETQLLDRKPVDRHSRNRGVDAVTRMRVLEVARRSLEEASEGDRCEERRLAECIAAIERGPLTSGEEKRCSRPWRPTPNRTPSCDPLEDQARVSTGDREANSAREKEPRRQQTKTREDRLSIRLVAHSMGAIVADRLLDRHDDLYFSEVVYLGAASTIKDFSEQALPYLVNNPSTRFSARTLHPTNEAHEWWRWYGFFGFLPRGSLLEWIDLYLTEPRSKVDRTFGSWNNVADLLPQIRFMESSSRERLCIRGFGLKDGPREHGQLNDPPEPGDSYRYWEGFDCPATSEEATAP